MRKKASGSRTDLAAKVKGAADVMLGTDPESAGKEFDIRSGTILTFVLIFALGWMPYIGLMVAGFVGGRRSGSPYRGFAATAIATLLALFVMWVITFLLQTINAALYNDPEAEIALIEATSPTLAAILTAMISYLRQLFGSTTGLSINYALYMMVIGFGIIGGVIADQSKKETRLIIQHADKQSARKIRSLDSYRSGRPMGFETYDDYKQFAVNTTAVACRNALESEKETVVKEVPPVVTTTVGTEKSANATPTSAEKKNIFSGALRSKKSSVRDKESSDDSTSDNEVFI